MLLRTGVVMMAVSVLLAAAVALVVSLLERAPAMPDMEESAQVEPLAAESKAQEENEKKAEIGQKLEIDDEQPADEARKEGSRSRSEGAPRADNVSPRGGESTPRSAEKGASRGGDSTPRAAEKGASRADNVSPRGQESVPRRGSLESLPFLNTANWLPPTAEELSWVDGPRYFDPDSEATMTLTIEALGLYNVPVIDSNSEEALGRGVIHIPDTAYPWDDSDQKNVFLAGHRVGLPGTDGRLLLFQLDELSSGDLIVIKDAGGQSYEYSVTELFRVEPEDAWVADTLVGRDLLTLSTCTYPTFEDRLIVRADRR